MPRVRRIAGSLVAVIALLLAALVVAGMALEDRTRRGIAERIAESLHADAAIERGDLALVRGSLDLASLAVRRDDVVGHLAIRVATMHCELPPLGLALVDRDCRALEVTGMRLEVSAAALFKLPHPKRPPLHARRVVIDDARFEFAPSAFVPDLGRVAIRIDHAEAGETRFVTPLSWLFALRALRATIELPANLTIDIAYDGSELRISGSPGSPLGTAPIALPVALPTANPADDARAELARLIAFGKDLGERLVVQRAADWLHGR